MTRKLIPELSSDCCLSLLTDSIDIHVQHVGSPVIHNVESWSALHDLFHLCNALLVIDNFTLSISRSSSHCAAFVHRQNCTFRVSDYKIDIHAATRSISEKNITLDAVMLQRFTQDTLSTIILCCTFCWNRRRIIHWTRGHNTSRVDNWSIISTSNFPLTDRIVHECPLALHSHQKTLCDELRNSVGIHRSTIAFLNAKNISCSIQSWSLKIIIL